MYVPFSTTEDIRYLYRFDKEKVVINYKLILDLNLLTFIVRASLFVRELIEIREFRCLYGGRSGGSLSGTILFKISNNSFLFIILVLEILGLSLEVRKA